MVATDRRVVVLFGCGQLADGFRAAGFDSHVVESVDKWEAVVRDVQPRASVYLPEADGTESVSQIVTRLEQLPFTDTIVWAPSASATLVRDALNAGARDVLLTRDEHGLVEQVVKIVDSQQFLPRLLRLGKRPSSSWKFEGILSRSRVMWDLFETCVQTAPTNVSVLILGETGTGKELVARAIHSRSGRTGSFVALNCLAVPENLVDSELFGYVKGAFTGASGSKQGLFRAADGGTLFLDEIGNIPLGVQHRLLRALQEGTVRPVGGEHEVAHDARIIAATSVNLEDAVKRGLFRADLLYRLDVIRLIVPPLRERPEDILLLFGHFSRQLSRQYDIARPDVSDSFIDALQSHDWPGNVRELENFTERMLLTQRGRRRTRQHFRRLMKGFRSRRLADVPKETTNDTSSMPFDIDLQDTLPDAVSAATSYIERVYLTRCLHENEGRIADTADQAGISRRTLLRKLQQLGIDKRDYIP